jgi:hypothetical protein
MSPGAIKLPAAPQCAYPRHMGLRADSPGVPTSGFVCLLLLEARPVDFAILFHLPGSRDT